MIPPSGNSHAITSEHPTSDAALDGTSAASQSSITPSTAPLSTAGRSDGLFNCHIQISK